MFVADMWGIGQSSFGDSIHRIMPIVHVSLRMIHIILGFVGLALFWLIIALPKGSSLHIRCGRIFACVTWIVGGSALISSAWALVHLDSFVSFPADSIDREGLRESYHFIFSILLYLSAATMSGAAFGVEVVRQRERHEALRRTSLPFWLSMTAACAFGLIVFGIWGLAAKETVTGGMPWVAYFIPLLVGVIGVGSVRSEWRYVFGSAVGKRAWLRQHVWHMCGTGVAFHTAFLVFGANRMFGYRLPGAWALVPWIAPPLMGMTLTAWYLRRLRLVPIEPRLVASGS